MIIIQFFKRLWYRLRPRKVIMMSMPLNVLNENYEIIAPEAIEAFLKDQKHVGYSMGYVVVRQFHERDIDGQSEED